MIDQTVTINTIPVPPFGYYVVHHKGTFYGDKCPVCGKPVRQEDTHTHLVKEDSNWNDYKR